VRKLKLLLSAVADKRVLGASFRESALYFFLEKKVAKIQEPHEAPRDLTPVGIIPAGTHFDFSLSTFHAHEKPKWRCPFPLSNALMPTPVCMGLV
jgi:hypothetical protein